MIHQVLLTTLVVALISFGRGAVKTIGGLDPNDDAPLDVVLAVHEWAMERAADVEIEQRARIPDWATPGSGAVYSVDFYRSVLTGQVLYRIRLVGVGTSVHDALQKALPSMEPALPRGLAFMDENSYLAWAVPGGEKLQRIHPTLSAAHRAAAKAAVVDRLRIEQEELKRQERAVRESAAGTSRTRRDARQTDRGERWKGEPTDKPTPETPKPDKLKKDTGDITTSGEKLGATLVAAGTELAAAWADFNGDGVVDYCTVLRLEDGRHFLRVRLSTGRTVIGRGSGSVIESSSPIEPGYESGRAWADFNGDGRADYMRIVGMPDSQHIQVSLSTGTGFNHLNPQRIVDWGYPESDARAWIDWDGDGRADFARLVGMPGQYSVRVSFSYGTGVAGDVLSSSGTDIGYPGTRLWLDLSGDGRADFVRVVGNGRDHVKVLLSNGRGFGTEILERLVRRFAF